MCEHPLKVEHRIGRNLLGKRNARLVRPQPDAVHACIDGEVERRPDAERNRCGRERRSLLFGENRRADSGANQRRIVVARHGAENQNRLLDSLFPQLQGLLGRRNAVKGDIGRNHLTDGSRAVPVAVRLHDARHFDASRQGSLHGLHVVTERCFADFGIDAALFSLFLLHFRSLLSHIFEFDGLRGPHHRRNRVGNVPRENAVQRELARRNLSGAPVQVGAVGRRRTGFHAEA